jgi:DNA (cytosine-5)-methyltransferase 1
MMMVLRHLDLFSGIGGFSLGLEATGGFKTVAFCDIEEFPRKVLQKHWPHVKQYEDIKELDYDKLRSDGIISDNEKIDIITGGYPCQPFSVAGRKKGEKDPRHLWPEYFRLVQELRPTWVIGENVGGHIKLGLDTVLENLESEGYAVRTFSIPASAIGANHKRERIWIVANTDSGGNKGEKSRGIGKENEEEKRDRKINSTTRFPNGADSIVTKQGSETEVEYVEDTGRSLRQGTFIRGENEKEIGQGNADLTQRSGEASQFDVADTESKRTRKNDERVWERSSRASGRETTTVADTVSGNAQAGCERRREIRKGHQGEGVSSDASGGGETMADTKSSSGNVNEINREHGETETQEILGDGSSLSRTQVESPWEGWWDIEPDVGRVAYGISARTHRLKGLGNSLVPAIPYHIGNVILEVMKNG